MEQLQSCCIVVHSMTQNHKQFTDLLKRIIVDLADHFSQQIFSPASHEFTKQLFFFLHTSFIFLHYKESLRVVPLLTLTGPRLGDIEVTQVICDAFVFRELDKFCLLDFAPVLGSPLCRVAMLLLTGHVRPADPVFVLSLALQVSQSVAFHLPGNLSWTSMLSNPLLTRDAFPQKGQGEEHGGPLFLKRKNS